jgi:hypothetical protein
LLEGRRASHNRGSSFFIAENAHEKGASKKELPVYK